MFISNRTSIIIAKRLSIVHRADHWLSFGLVDMRIGACTPHTNILFFTDFGCFSLIKVFIDGYSYTIWLDISYVFYPQASMMMQCNIGLGSSDIHF